jgi:hypothetical protein
MIPIWIYFQTILNFQQVLIIRLKANLCSLGRIAQSALITPLDSIAKFKPHQIDTLCLLEK